MRTRLLLLGIGLIVGALVTSAAVWANGLRTDLVSTSGSGSAKVPQMDVASTYLFEAAELCVDGRERVTITKVRPVISEGSTGDVRIADFHLSPTDNAPSQWRKLKPGEEVIDPSNPLTNHISLNCEPSNYDRRTLAVRLDVPQAPVALQGVDIDYTVHGITKTLRTDVGLAMCRGDEKPEDAPMVDDPDGDNVLLRCFDEDD